MPKSCRTILRKCLYKRAVTKKEYEKLERNLLRWIPCSERLPEEDGYYLVTNSKWGAPWREIVLWMTDGWQSGNKPIAWMPLPEPYKGEEQHE